MRPRWHKVLADLWSNKARSLTVIASISVGLFAIGMISSVYAWLGDAMRTGYAAVNPANVIVTSAGYPLDFLDRVRHLPNVKEAEGAAVYTMRLKKGQESTIQIDVHALPDIGKMKINQVTLLEGRWPPDEHEIVLDVNKAADTGAKVGDSITLRLTSGKLRSLKVVGIVRDMTIGAGGLGGGFFLAPVQGYVTYDTLAWLEQPELLNKLYVTVAQGGEDTAQIRKVSKRVVTEFERNGLVALSTVDRRSSEHPNNHYLDSLLGVLYMLGMLVVFLSGFLIINTLSALLNQQIQQVGVMKTIGASRAQIIGVYMVLILVYSLIALGLALLFSDRAAYLELEFLAGRINFNLPQVHRVPLSLMLQTVIALVVPQLAGAIPILQGSRLSIQQALSGISSGMSDRHGRIYNWLTRVRGLSRPLMISLRNTFRRRLRLVLTLITLVLGGSIFIGTFNVSGSIQHYVDRLGKYYVADVNLTLSQPASIDEMRQVLSQVPKVTAVEGWAAVNAELTSADGGNGESVMLVAPPADSKLIEPMMRGGRWLQPGDQNAIVLNELFTEKNPQLKIGDMIQLKVNGMEKDWVIVGFFQFAGKSGGLLAYTTYDYLSKLVGTPGKASMLRVVAADDMHTLDKQLGLADDLEAHLNRLGYQISDIRAGKSLQNSTAQGLNTLTTFLLILSLMMAAVGSIGLMGTMSLNVMERTREIGIMRAVGATDRVIMRMVIIEGMLIGLISWAFSCLASFPIGKALSDVISLSLFNSPIDYIAAPDGFVIWLGLVLALSIFSSVLPARSAARLTIREVLAYE